MAKRYLVSIPASIVVEVEGDGDFDEDTLVDAVFEQRGKYIEVDARTLGYEQYTVLDELGGE